MNLVGDIMLGCFHIYYHFKVTLRAWCHYFYYMDENLKMSNFSKKKMVVSGRPRNAARSDFMNVTLSWGLREDLEGK